MAPEHIIARFAVAEDTRGLILGLVINKEDELLPGHLYQNVLDTPDHPRPGFVIRNERHSRPWRLL